MLRKCSPNQHPICSVRHLLLLILALMVDFQCLAVLQKTAFHLWYKLYLIQWREKKKRGRIVLRISSKILLCCLLMMFFSCLFHPVNDIGL